MSTTQATKAQTILQQLGGSRFLAMTGARGLVDHGNALTMKISGATNVRKMKPNYVRITICENDLYQVESFRFRGLELKALESREFIYADQLARTFTDLTGLDTSL